MIRLKYLIASLIGSIILTVAARQQHTEEHSSLNPLLGKSFALRSTVYTRFSNGNYHIEQIEESYSFEQKRARLSFKLATHAKSRQILKPELGLFLLDTSRDEALLVDRVSLSCSLSSVDEISKLLSLSNYPNPDGEGQVADDYIIGPARLLFVVAKYRKHLKLKPRETITRVRNIPCLEYLLELDTKSGANVQLTVFFSEATMLMDEGSLPMRIIAKTSNQQVQVIEFSQFELLPQLGKISQEHRQGLQLLDQFAFQTLAGCSKVLDGKAEDLFTTKVTSNTKFSFKANIGYLSVNSGKPINLETFVAYDARLNSMRFDIQQPNDKVSGVRRQIFNFKLNRMYHVMEKIVGSNTNIDQVFNIGAQDSDSRSAAGSSTSSGSFHQCMMAKIVPSIDENRYLFTIGHLLAGANKFVYMGRAQVRGIQARVYEAHNCSLPFWLDQPVAYKTKDGVLNLRLPEHGLRKDTKSTITALLYLAESIDDHPLLLLEIYKLKSKYPIIYGKQTVDFYDFNWDLAHEAPNGDRAIELFSLEDFCSAGLGLNEYARVELLLGSELEALDWNPTLNYTTSRNLAIMSGLQEDLKLPATMIFDLESKVLAHSANQNNDTKAIAISFRVAEHSDNLIDLIYLGQGNVNKMVKVPPTGSVRRSFQACLFVAAHRKVNTFFGYNLDNRNCFIDFESIFEPEQDIKNPPGFKMRIGEAIEVFGTNHIRNGDNFVDAMSSIRAAWGKTLRLSSESPWGSPLFYVRKVMIDERDYKNSIAMPSQERKTEESLETDKISGFGLATSTPKTRRVVTEEQTSATGKPLAMTFEQCQAACTSSFSCQSFSICIRNTEIECLASELNFRSLKVIKQLNDLRHSLRLIRGAKVNFTLSNDQQRVVELERHPNCELHNKIFLNMFKRLDRVAYTFANRSAFPVGGEEECAEMCVRQNLKVLGEDVEQAKKTVQSFSVESIEHLPADSIRNLVKEHRKATQRVCRAFLYLDRAELPKEAQNTLTKGDQVGDQKSPEAGGYCLVGGKEFEGAVSESVHLDRYVDLERYEFKFELFYERKYGSRLLPSKANEQVFSAYNEAKRQSEYANQSSYSLLRDKLKSGDNFQELIVADASKCALTCFTQSWGPWPACSSFDVAIERRADRFVFKCYLNSLTMSRAVASNRLDLIEKQKEIQLELWHYEPRAGFALGKSMLDGNLELAQDELFGRKNETATNSIHAFGTFLIVILGLILGSLTGIQFGRKFIPAGNQPIINDTRMLIRRPTVEFHNQVNYEGQVRE